MIVKDLDQMTAKECLELKKEMIYPWEMKAFESGELNISEKDLRFHLLDALDQRIVDIECGD